MSSITKFVLRRPVTTLLAVLCLIFFGGMSLLNAKLELMPDIEMPMMIVTTTYSGASPEDVDELVTKPIEEGIAVLSDVKKITSQSSENFSMVLIRYEYGTDMDQAYDDLKKKVDSIKNNLPDDAGDPSFMEMNINEQASINLAINNPAQENMYNYVENDISPEFEKLTPVASVSSSGGRKSYVRIQLIPEKLTQYHLTMSTVASVVSAADFKYPAGTTGVGSQNLSVTTGVTYDSVDSLKSIPIITGTGNTIYLSDIAEIEPALEDQTAIGRYNGTNTITLGITKTQDESAVNLSREVNAEIKKLEANDPNLKITVIEDAADTIKDSLSSVFETMIMAVIISMAIIYIFFGDWKASLIVGTSIPISILGALVFMWAMGYSMNMVTLSALVLGVGMMVDNSIVVLEACFRGMDHFTDIGNAERRSAAMDSIRTVGASVFGSTLTTCVVFAPLGFMKGLSGQFFAPLGFTIVFCMTASLISAVSIVPLCFVMYRPVENTKAPAYKGVRSMQNGYRKIVDKLLNHKALVMITSVVLLALSILLATQVRTELMPQTDEGTVTISVKTKPGLKVESVDKILTNIEDMVAKDPDTKNYMVTSGASGVASMFSNSGSSVTAYLKSDRSMPTKEKADLWRKALDGTPDAVITVESYSMMSSLSTAQNTYESIITATDYDALKSASDKIVDDLHKRTDVTAVHSTLENAAPLIKLKVDPIRAAAEGLSPLQAAQQVNQLLSGKEAMKMDVDGQNVSVMVKYPEGDLDSIDKVKDIMLTTNAGTEVKLSDVCDIAYEDSPAGITRSDRKYQATITADYTEEAGKTTKAALDKDVVGRYLNDDVTIAENSQTESMNEEFGALGLAIAIAVFLVFVVMAAQFESMRFSLMVMTTIPFSLIGAFGLLWICDATISMNSLLGFLMLVGTVVNNGILYVDTVNQYREEMPIRRALIEAGATRLRPILMTTLTTVVSMYPMAAAFGNNGKMMQGLALVDVGGLTASTILALLMLPIYYLLMDRKKKNVVKDIPSAGYMEGKNPAEELARKKELERKAREEGVLADPPENDSNL